MSKSLKNEKASVLSLSGASSKQMMTYVKPTIEEKPDFIILHTETNNLRSNADPEEIADSIRGGSRTAATSKMERFVIIVNGFQPLSIVGVAVSCKENGSGVVVSAMLPRRDKLNEKGTVVNEKTKELCLKKNIYFLQYRNFNPKNHLNGRKLHPNKMVSGILAFNFLQYFNNT